MEKVIIYDGECRLCRNAVSFIQRHNSRGAFDFVPLQSDKGRSVISSLKIPEKDTNTVIFLHDRRYSLRSSAIINILKEMGGIWKIFYPFILIPSFLRDPFYRLVAGLRK